MATAMDSAIGQVVAALKDTGMYNDTVIVFTSDVREPPDVMSASEGGGGDGKADVVKEVASILYH